MADSTALALTTGIAPGRPRHTGQTWVLGSAPNSVAHPQNIFEAVFSSTCTSSPNAGSKRSSASSNDIVETVVVMRPPGRAQGEPAGRPTGPAAASPARPRRGTPG